MATWFVRAGLAIVIAGCAAVSSWAQPAQTGTISGVISDATAAMLPGVTVTLTSEERGFSRSTVTDSVGRFVFPAV
ncbi:MAG: carboxypeptidase-like regulatory domain-containing protein, partial [Acidobacteriota bacterium]